MNYSKQDIKDILQKTAAADREHGQTAATRILPVNCEICTQKVDQPTSMNFVSWGGKQIRWLICEGCTLILTNHIKKMAKKADAIPQT